VGNGTSQTDEAAQDGALRTMRRGSDVNLLQAARSAYAAGLCLLPISADGRKAPDVPAWKSFQTARPTGAEMRGFDFASRCGFGIVAGAVSGYRESWDFDALDVFEAFVQAADACGLGAIVRRIREGYEDETPGGGRRWIVTFPETVEWQDCTLARRAGRPGEPKVKTLIELPTFAIVAPSSGATHPSGKPYVRVSGGFETIASYTADERASLLALARSFDQMPRPEAIARSSAAVSGPGDRPGDDYNRRASWADILPDWKKVHQRDETIYLRRPGKANGISATINHGGTDRLYVFTSSTAFDPDTSYTKFSAYTALYHGGDYGKAARALADLGYGQQRQIAQPRCGDFPRAVENEPTAAKTSTRYAVVTRLADIEPQAIEFIWSRRLARGRLHLLIGDPGLGKSFVALDIAARVTKALNWPDGGQAPLGNVLVLSAEDNAADTIRPRADALGADVDRIHVLTAVHTEGTATDQDQHLSLITDLPLLEAAIVDTGALVVIVDPLSAYLGMTVDSYKDPHIRTVLAPLAGLAERHRVAVLGIMHLNKSSDRRAIYRALGSVAFIAAARLVFAVAPNPENDEQRLLTPVKTNVCATASNLAYTLSSGRLVWSSDPAPTLTADELLAREAHRVRARPDAAEWLQGVLADGQVKVQVLQQEAKAAGFAWRTVERAKSELRIDAVRIGGLGAAGDWYWVLPSKGPVKVLHLVPKAASVPEVAALGAEAADVGDLAAADPKTANSDTLAALGDAGRSVAALAPATGDVTGRVNTEELPLAPNHLVAPFPDSDEDDVDGERF
jgi:hypothetical protein